MKTLLLLVTLTVALLCSAGCMGLSGVARQLKDDPAFVTVDVSTIYGRGRLVRDGRAGNGNNVTMDAASSVLPTLPAPVMAPPTQLIYVTNTVREVVMPGVQPATSARRAATQARSSVGGTNTSIRALPPRARRMELQSNPQPNP